MRLRFDPWVGKIPWRRKWQPTPVFLPRESYGQGSHGFAKNRMRLSAQESSLQRCLPTPGLDDQEIFLKWSVQRCIRKTSCGRQMTGQCGLAIFEWNRVRWSQSIAPFPCNNCIFTYSFQKHEKRFICLIYRFNYTAKVRKATLPWAHL